MELNIYTFVTGLVVMVLGTGGLSYAANKAALNGFKLFTSEKLKSIEETVHRIDDRTIQHGEDIAVLKSHIDTE